MTSMVEKPNHVGQQGPSAEPMGSTLSIVEAQDLFNWKLNQAPINRIFSLSGD